VKFADAELLGVPLVVVVGRGLAEGVVEVRPRVPAEDGSGVEQVPVAVAADRVAELVDVLLAR
jgi:prolyl-tRNA synthetase